MLREGEFTTRFLEVGHPDVDTMIRVYNRMVDDLREERVRLQEQQYFLGPAAGRVAGRRDRPRPRRPGLGRQPGRGDGCSRRRRRRSRAGRSPTCVRRSPRRSAGRRRASRAPSPCRMAGACAGQCATFVERGHPRRFYLVEELTEELRQTEKSAYEKLIRMMSHEVNNTVGATRSLLQSSLAYGEGLPAPRRAELRGGARHRRGIVSSGSTASCAAFADVVRMPQPVKRPTDVLRLLEACVRLVQAQTDRRASRGGGSARASSACSTWTRRRWSRPSSTC